MRSQVCNSLGVARGLHKQNGCQVAVHSLPADERFCEDNILLPVLSRAKVFKDHGMSRVLCGVDADGVQHAEPNFASDMRALDEGRSRTTVARPRFPHLPHLSSIPTPTAPATLSRPDLLLASPPTASTTIPTASITEGAGTMSRITTLTHRVRWINIPDDERGGLKRVRLRAWIIVVGADYPAAQSLLPFMESPKAHRFCRGCDVDQSDDVANRPFSFLRRSVHQCAGVKRGRTPAWVERDWEALCARLAQLKAAGAANGSKEFSALGINKLAFAFDPQYIPHVHPIKIAPQDLLHLFPDGLMRSEGAWLFYVLFKMGLSVADVNAAIRRYRGFPRDVRRCYHRC